MTKTKFLMIKTLHFFVILLFSFCLTIQVNAQIELVPPSHPVYDYLKRMQVKGIIPEYNSSNIPISRGEIAGYLKIIEGQKLTGTDKYMMEDYKAEFEFDMTGSLRKSTNLFNKFNSESIFGNHRQKYIYNYADTNASLFFDINGDFYQRNSKGDSIGNNAITLGELGFRIRGSLYNSVGFYLRASNGQKIKGQSKDIIFAANYDPLLKANTKFVNEQKNFDSYEGYLRYQTPSNWLSVTVGKEALYEGFGYIDKMFLSNNTIPFNFLKLDIAYKKFKYSFLYGSIKGDSLGIDLQSKNIVSHRLDIGLTRKFKLGFYESVIISNNPFSFTYLNPISFLTSADLNTGAKETTDNNTLAGFDFELAPIKNITFQGTLLIDDLNLSTLYKSDSTSNDNKFGYQLGIFWADALSLPNVNLKLEYTRLDPFVYSHRSNKSSYTNWDMSLGHALPPNSDEIALNLHYDVTNRIKFNFLYQFQRSGEGILIDSITGKLIINYGGNINRGDGDLYITKINFLNGNRINRSIITFNLVFEPIKQYFVELKYQLRILNLKYLDRQVNESLYWATLRVDL